MLDYEELYKKAMTDWYERLECTGQIIEGLRRAIRPLKQDNSEGGDIKENKDA